MNKTIGEQNYEQFADRYAEAAETKPHNAYYERPATLSLLPDVTGLKVLDAGCGPGIYTEWLVQHGAKVVAVDVTPRFVEITRQRVGDRAEVLIADLNQRLKFAADRTFDLVVCPLVLDYVEDWRSVFREYFRILKSDGIVVFSCGNPLGDYLFLTRLGIEIKQYSAVQRFEVEWSGFGDPKPKMTGFRRPFQEIINPVIEAGFHIDKVLEPQPTEEFRRVAPQDYERLRRRPGFICIRAKKF
ncbi:MAG: class I SAM-dependent methyltransferase [Anaerolineae bacterium]|nr:class I SAM-dependent methyltransferase [Anaerolineae bacterium]